MTMKITGNTLGGVLEANGTPAANVTSTSGLPFCKNKLFNGEVTRINQRSFDGNWTPKGTWSAGNTIAQQELCYGWDCWAKASATDMVQPIEAGNFRPSTIHTISGLNMTTRQETSPASGNWNIVVPQAARNVQVEEGSVATPFEVRPIGFELAQCQRYFRTYCNEFRIDFYNSVASPDYFFPIAFSTMRTSPYVSIVDNNSSGPPYSNFVTPFSAVIGINATGSGESLMFFNSITLSAVI